MEAAGEGRGEGLGEGKGRTVTGFSSSLDEVTSCTINPAQMVTNAVTKDRQIKAQRSLKKRNDFMNAQSYGTHRYPTEVQPKLETS